RFNARRAGGSGRRKLCVVDWDGDGKLDILINSKNAELWRQTGEIDGGFTFKNMGSVSETALAGHTSSPTAVDFENDGIPDLVVGAEDGYLYHMRNPRNQACDGAK
ncbi:MAG: VCBS repeat-containing protein, partial [Kiritimatiellae bacterium]|nr:VCBS repeat-containing protein [Kiritimatiellia bacterium]